MSDSITATTEYNELLDCIKQTLATGQLRAARVVNNLLVETYWQIGREIVTRQREQGWGARVIERLSADLRTARPDARGLSVRNLRYMAALATRWPTEIVQCGVAQLPWSLVATLLDSCPDQETSEFYAKRAAQEGWTRGVLQAMIASRLHERSQPALTTFDQAVPDVDREAVRQIVKDPFILDFLAADPVRERDLSKALTDNLARFLRELETGFTFVGAEVPVQCGDHEFFVDLLFYHYRLHRFVVFELGRFRDEIAFLLAHPETAGIVPLLDSRISEDTGEASWYVMPVATPIREALGSDPEPGVVVAAIGEIATTLASLAAERVAHRDIKPDNLFELDGRWVVGDFGLVTYPHKGPSHPAWPQARADRIHGSGDAPGRRPEPRDRVAALTATSRQHVTQQQERQSLLIEAWQELAQIVADTATELSEQLTFYVHSHDSGYRAAELLERPPRPITGRAPDGCFHRRARTGLP